MKTLTRAEEQLMHYLWKIEKGVLKEIVDQFPEPKPATSTVGTVIRNLVEKKFIAFERYGKVNLYYPRIGKNEYFKVQFNGLMNDYFNNSVKKFASFFSSDTDLNLTELEEIKYIIEDEINKKKLNG
mgnify:CR=1 FL=1